VKKVIVCIGLFLVGGLALALSSGTQPASTLSVQPDFGCPPLYFFPNRGQTDHRALFYAKTGGYTLWLTEDGLTFDDGSVSRLIFKNANPNTEVSASDLADYRVSYFYGVDESAWSTDLPTSRAVVYRNLYDGIDLKVYGAERQVEYDWIVEPGAQADQIRWTYAGVSKMSLDPNGNLVVETPSGRLVHLRPVCYQVIDGRKVDVEAAFRKTASGEYGFAVGSYDARYDLTIDPVVLVFSTFLGGRGKDYNSSIAVDKTGAVYITGYTESPDFPLASKTGARNDIFVSKLSADGKSLIYSAFFPRANIKIVESAPPKIAIDGTGAVYIAGRVYTHKFPVKNAIQETFGGGRSDAVILELTPDGKSLVFSTYLGGSGADAAKGIALDAAGSIYVGGDTFSQDFPVKKAFQESIAGSFDVFISKLSPSGQSLVYSTFLGSSNYEILEGLAVDNTGSAYISGLTMGQDYPVKNPFQNKHGGGVIDTFISKLAPSGKDLVYSSYLGGSSDDQAADLAIDRTGAAYVLGVTKGGFPVKNAFRNTPAGEQDGFLTKFAPDGRSLVYSTYLGGAGLDAATSIAVDRSGAAYITGNTISSNWPLKNPYQGKFKGKVDAFLTILVPNGRSLIYSTYLGDNYEDYGTGIAVDLKGGIYISGWTGSHEFPVLKSYQMTYAGHFDIFIAKFSSR